MSVCPFSGRCHADFTNRTDFFGISLLLGLTPGPDNLFVLMQSATQGRKAGMLVVFGLSTGIVVHTCAIAMGLAALFAASATAFLVLKFIGAAYLPIWRGALITLRSAIRQTTARRSCVRRNCIYAALS
jgi:threonine/homoserine/homoserine lactone efflux protein